MINTSVAIFIKNKKLLMDRRSKSRRVYPGFLMCPSGHIENGESNSDALKREMLEELGINVIDSEYLFSINDTDPFSKLDFLHNFLLVKSFKGKITESKEAKKLLWCSYENLLNQELTLIVNKLITKLHLQNLI